MPERIQRRRTKGWRMPQTAVYVGRPSIFSNPFKVGDIPMFGDTKGCPIVSRQEAVDLFRVSLQVQQDPCLKRLEDDDWAQIILDNVFLLKDCDLACWCPLDSPCHADVLLKLANP